MEERCSEGFRREPGTQNPCSAPATEERTVECAGCPRLQERSGLASSFFCKPHGFRHLGRSWSQQCSAPPTSCRKIRLIFSPNQVSVPKQERRNYQPRMRFSYSCFRCTSFSFFSIPNRSPAKQRTYIFKTLRPLPAFQARRSVHPPGRYAKRA